MTAIFLYVALVILAIAAILAVRKRKEAGKWISCLTTGTVFAVFLMVLPTQWIEDGQTFWSPLLYKLISSASYSIKSLGGGQDLKQLETIALTGWERALYMGVNYLIVIAAPLLTSSLILSFVGDTIDRIRYFFTFTPKCYVFSEANANTIAIAKGIRKTPGRKAIVFCNGKNIDKQLSRQIRNLHGLILYTPCSALKLHSPRQVKAYEINLLSGQEDRNIDLAESLISQKKQLKNRKLTVNAFVRSTTDVNILESMMKERTSQPDANCFMKIRFMNEFGLFCNNLLYQHPLFESLGNRKTISVLIIGCGDLGKEMLKTALWNGQMEGCALKIRILDKDADLVQQHILAQCPELRHYSIEFIKADAQVPTFEEAVRKCNDATFVCVATGSDALNISTAENVYQIFHRHDPTTTPPIYTRIRNTTKANNLSLHSTYLTERNIHIFGTVESIYSQCTLFHSEFEKLAFAVHLCYNGQLDADASTYQDALYSFETSAYNRRSSMAVALHIPVKLYQCGFRDFSSLTDISEEQLQQIEKILTDPSVVDALARNEHDRWNAFMCSEGYRKADIDTMCKYAPIFGSHKDKNGYMHPCIVPWEELDAVQEAYNSLGISVKNFKASDYLIVSSIPKIIRKAKNL